MVFLRAFLIVAIGYAAGGQGSQPEKPSQQEHPTERQQEQQEDGFPYYYKRFRDLLSKRRYEAAILDLSKALEIRPRHTQALAQRGKLQLLLGYCALAVDDYRLLKEVDAAHKDVDGGLHAAESCSNFLRGKEEAFAVGDWQRAIDNIDGALELTESAPHLLMDRARCSNKLENWYEVVADAGRVIKHESTNVEALLMRGWAYYRLNDMDMAANHFREILKSDPEHGEAKKGHHHVRAIAKKNAKAEKKFQAAEYKAAAELWREVTTMDAALRPLVSSALLNVARAEKMLGEWEAVKVAAMEALNVDGDAPDALEIIGDAQMALEQFEEAVQTFKTARQKDQGSKNLEQKQRRAEVALKQSKMKNYYKTLGVSRNASSKEIKTAYRELALMWHPDKVKGSAEEKEAAETKFQAIGEAHEVLSDPELRAKYDRGEEVFENQGGGGQQQRNPFQGNFHHHQRGGFHFRFG